MRWKISLFSVLILLGIMACSNGYTPKPRPGKAHSHEMWINKSYAPESDRVTVTVQLKVPNSYLVFVKENNQFKAALDFSITVTDEETEKQAYKRSWSDVVFEAYYEDTRDANLFHVGEHRFTLEPGEYKFSAIIEDSDSRHQWKLKETVNISPPEFWSEIMPMVRLDGVLRHIGNRFTEIDTLFTRFQLTDPFNTERLLAYEIKQDDEILQEGEINLDQHLSGDFYYVPFPIHDEWSGNLSLTLNMGTRSQDMTVKLYRDTVDSYLVDLEESVKWMSVILPYSDHKDLKNMKPEEQRNYLVEYWNSVDPTPDTEYNELLDEFYTRVLFANENFGVLTEGWRSDQGRVYIKYGRPANVENTGTDGYGRSYQIWYYQSNKQFVFINDGFGDYRLVRELN